MIMLNGFDSYMLYKFLAGLFHTNIDSIYWSVTFIASALALIIYIVCCLIIRSKR